MTLRIVEIHRVLKPTGSFYLHCDPTASHYLKLVLDAVFCGQGGDYLAEIVWLRTNAHNMKSRGWPRSNDTIFFYTKGRTFTFNPQFGGHSDAQLKRYKVDQNGRLYTGQDLTFSTPNPERQFEWRGSQPPPHRSWGASREQLEEWWAQGLILKKKDGTPRLDGHKMYLDEKAGKPFDTNWIDIPRVGNTAEERMGYPTQKPEGLLERIINASSNEGDVVLDAYCGCGTTVAVAQRLERQWIGIDITYQSIALILKRFQDTYEKNGTWPAVEANIQLDGVPRDLESAMALANRKDDKTRKEFEKWAVLTYSRNQARINEKKGADGGIDGIAYFLKDRDENGKAVFQVKSRPGTREDLAKLNSDRQREKADFGFLICTGPLAPTKAMRDEIAAAGKYKHPLLDREDDRLQVVMVAEMFDHPGRPGKRLDLPMARADAVKSAAALGDADKQIGLL